MQPRVPAHAALVWLSVFVLFSAPVAPAQPPITISIPTQSDEIGEVVRSGRQLEVEQRWGEALAHYEAALRDHPDDADLRRRYDACRLHYDLNSRCRDRSFCELVTNLSPAEALDLYSQVLLKIQSYYVEVPHWKELVERGTNTFEVALSEPAFLSRHLPKTDRATIRALRDELRRTLGPRVIQSRGDARDAVSLAAQLASQRTGISPTAVVLEYTCGAANTLDAYSAYLTPDQFTDVHAQIEGHFVGLGIELSTEGGYLTIVRVIPGSPAEEQGILPGDQIAAVDGQSTLDLPTDHAANLLQGEADSVVDLLVVTPGQSPRSMRIRRRDVEVHSVEAARIVDRQRGIAYLRLTCFQKTTYDELDAALRMLHRDGMRSLIMDLRGNPGGLLSTAVEVVDLFVDRGIIVSTRGRRIQEDYTYSAHSAGTWRVPLVVMIDQDSASAAEIFAGAIRDHRRGTIVGHRSFGKGSVQGIFPLDYGQAGMRLTTSKFFSPTGRPYSHVGVEPHVAVHEVAKPIAGQVDLRPTTPDDPILSAALQAARGLTPQR